MANTLGDYQAWPVMALGANRRKSICIIPIGATGAVGTLDADQGWTVTRTSAGLYALVFPIVSSNARAVLKAGILLSTATTIDRVIVTAYAPTSGTASITCVTGSDTATDPANGDKLWVELVATIGGATP